MKPRPRTYLFAIALVLSFGVCRAHASAQDHRHDPALDGFRAGVALTEITPPAGGPMSGYGERHGALSTGVHDPLFARALTLEKGDVTVCLVSCDMLVITKGLRRNVEKRIEDLDLTMLTLAATHTHSGPGGYLKNFIFERLVMGRYDAKIEELLASRIAEAVREACASLVPARLGIGVTEVSGLSVNRRDPEGPVDPELVVIRIDQADGHPLAAVVQATAHPTVLSPRNLLYSADYPGMMSAAFQEKTGAPVLFFNGGAGDIAPHCVGCATWDDAIEEQFEAAHTIGTALAERASSVYVDTRTHTPSRLEVTEQIVSLPKLNIKASCFWYVLAPLARHVFGKIMEGFTIFQAVAIDDTVFVALPCEPSSGLTRRIKSLRPSTRVFVWSYTNDCVSYVLEEQDYRKGGYEACMSFYGPTFGAFVTQEAGALIESLSGR